MDKKTQKKYIEKLINKLYLNHLETLHLCEQIYNLLDNNKNKFYKNIVMDCIDDHTTNYNIINEYINKLKEECFIY